VLPTETVDCMCPGRVHAMLCYLCCLTWARDIAESAGSSVHDAAGPVSWRSRQASLAWGSREEPDCPARSETRKAESDRETDNKIICLPSVCGGNGRCYVTRTARYVAGQEWVLANKSPIPWQSVYSSFTIAGHRIRSSESVRAVCFPSKLKRTSREQKKVRCLVSCTHASVSSLDPVLACAVSRCARAVASPILPALQNQNRSRTQPEPGPELGRRCHRRCSWMSDFNRLQKVLQLARRLCHICSGCLGQPIQASGTERACSPSKPPA
jgi:hypothetical protein